MWHIHLLYKLYLYYNYETLKLVIDYPWRWRVLKFQNDKLKTKNSKKMAMIVFHHFFFYETLLLMFTKRTHREITSNALTSNRMSVCNFHYNKRLVRGLRNFFSSFLLPFKWLSYSRSCAVNQLFLFYMSLKRGVLFGV